MNVKILASGSSGNCIAVQSGAITFLVDCGLPKTKIEKRLIEEGIDPTKINAILITHAHGDHIKGLPLANKYGIDVYATEGEWKDIKGVDGELRYPIRPGETLTISNGIDWLDVIPFRTHHDSYDSLGYAIWDHDDKKVSICLDTGRVTEDMLEAMADSDIYVIEANHEPALVEVSSYPPSVQARILSDIGHLSNEQTAKALGRMVRGLGERIYLTHLSGSNNTQELAAATVKAELKRRRFMEGEHYSLEVV